MIPSDYAKGLKIPEGGGYLPRILAQRRFGYSSRSGVAAFLARVLPNKNAATFCSASPSLGSVPQAKRVVIFSYSTALLSS